KEAPSLRWGHMLERALDLSLENIPALPGSTLVLVDMSGSMSGSMSAKSKLTRMEAAALFGAALAKRNPLGVDLVQFGTGAEKVNFSQGDSVLRVANTRFRSMGGTNTQAA